MALQPLTYKKFIIGILAIVIIAFIIKLFQNTDNTDNIEHFQSILKKLKTTSNNSERFDNVNVNVSSSKENKRKSKIKSKLTFDDLVKETEDIDPSKYTISSLKNSLFSYVNSFKKEKFKNTTGTTTEALEKFDYFKEKFYEIFK
jgi:hypothetical protein